MRNSCFYILMKNSKLVSYDISSIDSSDSSSDDLNKLPKRQFEHHSGNWACSIYIKGKYSNIYNNKTVNLNKYIDKMYKKLQNTKIQIQEREKETLNIFINMKKFEYNEFHISLSKTVPIRWGWIPQFELFLKNLTHEIQMFEI